MMQSASLNKLLNNLLIPPPSITTYVCLCFDLTHLDYIHFINICAIFLDFLIIWSVKTWVSS